MNSINKIDLSNGSEKILNQNNKNENNSMLEIDPKQKNSLSINYIENAFGQLVLSNKLSNVNDCLHKEECLELNKKDKNLQLFSYSNSSNTPLKAKIEKNELNCFNKIINNNQNINFKLNDVKSKLYTDQKDYMIHKKINNFNKYALYN